MTSINRPASEPGLPAARDLFERRYGVFGDTERRELKIVTDEVRASGAGEGQFTVRGHAAVFDQWSLDLGGFREKIAAAAFDDVLSRNPDTWLLWDHDTRYVLARTTNKTLELRIDPRGLHYWARVAPTSYAADLRVLLERGDIDQASFAFTVAQDEWRITGEGDDEQVERTILEVGELFDVTVTAMGAYPQTDSQVARERAVDYATRTGRLPGGAELVEPQADEEATVEPPEGDAAEHRIAPAEPVGEETTPPSIHDLRATSRAGVREMRERHLLALKELLK
jgi:HK97 family phage prohead protease